MCNGFLHANCGLKEFISGFFWTAIGVALEWTGTRVVQRCKRRYSTSM
ncbi:hypothetical protein BIFCAT_01096 [Bifidobacterium catenulatum DSM 16992 = JCM 1194 = LMG 11043]|uniref:Uncharacterized protein n=1 Tax=Bifidobacterium catenulatum DSM 16992 = JCM 1194 = LMG 11043 TaxID=566552 RepID=B6XUB3_9BIFI|nr:hypothetical protein BIFCAT_01096 [Bifidobacterium catenulatum DSM 16992 = JCM 1194 = LMG 11043]